MQLFSHKFDCFNRPPEPWKTETARVITLRYLVLFDAGPGHLSGMVPDLPGCAAIGHSLVELRENLYEALEFHLEELVLKRKPLPVPTMSFDDVPRGSLAEWMTVRIRPDGGIHPYAMARPCPGR